MFTGIPDNAYYIEKSGDFTVLKNATFDTEEYFLNPIFVPHQNGCGYDLEICDDKSYTIIDDGTLHSIFGVSVSSITPELISGLNGQEVLVPFTRDVKDGESVSLQDIIDLYPNAVGIAGFDFDLKPIMGDPAGGGAQATTSEASSSGSIGERNLDPGGGYRVEVERNADGTYRRLASDQTFTAAAGSIATLTVEIIF